MSERQEGGVPPAATRARSTGAARPDAAAPVQTFLARWTGLIAMALAASLMLGWTWGTWPDVLIDFGRELYTPWQLTQGKVLYRDVASFHGPLSAYLNAAWFLLFGASLRTLVRCNPAILVLLLGLLYYAFRQVSSHGGAVAACLTFILLFAFGQYVLAGNYNYVCPYAHEMTHGLLLALAALVAAWQYPRHGLGALAACGLALGLAFLTKAEVFVPGAVAVLAAATLTAWQTRPGRRRLAAMAGSLAAGAAIPPAVAFGCLCLAMPAASALRGTLGSWATIASTELSQKFFRDSMGFDDVPRNLGLLLAWAAGYALVFVPAALLCLALRRPGLQRPLAALALLAWASGVWAAWPGKVPWVDAARPLPLFVLGAAAVFLVLLRRRAPGDPRAARLARQFTLALFALALLGKMLLFSRIYHYGFVLAMPATLLVVVGLVDWLPAAISGRGGAGPVFRVVAMGLLAVGIGAGLVRENAFLRLKTRPVGKGADAFRADVRGAFVDAVLHELAGRARPGDTLAVLPEGVMMNFLGRRENPTPYVFLTPFDVSLFGEQRILDAYRARPPDLIALVHSDMSEYGPRYFGTDYGRLIRDWVVANYEPLLLVGALPFQDERFGILLLRRKPGGAAAGQRRAAGS